MDIPNYPTSIKEEPSDPVETLDTELLEVKPDLELLLQSMKDGTSHSCSTCNATFLTNQDLMEHSQLHGDGRSKFFCLECNTSYSSKINLKIHLSSKMHQPNKPYQCGHCQKRFSLQIYLKRHKLCHVNSGSLIKCPDCWRKFFRLSDFLIHQKRHKDKEQKCNVCYRNFVSKSMLEMHKCGNRFECFCKKTYCTRKGLRLHQETHCVDKQHKCGLCDKMFSVKRYLQAHMAFHRGVLEAMICDICYKKFPRKSNLRLHMKSHKSLKCDLCNLPFNRKSDLRMHQKNHMKVHPCQICGKSFRSLSYLKRHKKKHDNSPPPVDCNLCGARLKSLPLLARHRAMKHHKRTEYSCHQCEKSFLNPVDLNLHAKVHQPVHVTFDDSPGLVGYLNYNVSLA